VTSPAAAQRTLEVHRQAFASEGLAAAWNRVLAMVVQPGVEFDHDSVVEYDAEKARNLVAWRRDARVPQVFEAHSTDYQLSEAYKSLVKDSFSILKVGPALTFALREALYALADIEQQLVLTAEQSRLASVVEEAMLQEPGSWQPYYHGDSAEQKRLRVYSYSDRMRYYWHTPRIAQAVDKLILNLEGVGIPETMLSRYMPEQYMRVRDRLIKNEPVSLVVDKVRDVLRIYAAACMDRS
jgi:D-tagatose-1,6-bisphosphate aldolase subunit GatZ/KbaZ